MNKFYDRMYSINCINKCDTLKKKLFDCVNDYNKTKKFCNEEMENYYMCKEKCKISLNLKIDNCNK